ncbi:MAG: hypothetical protein ACTHN4_08895 [Sphingomicrobium sp.]
MDSDNLLSLAAFLAIAFVAFRQLRTDQPPVRLFSLQSVPFAFMFWVGISAAAWAALAPADIHDTSGYVAIGIVQIVLCVAASAYTIMCLIRRK